MGNVELRFEVDRELMERLRAAGVDPATAAQRGLQDALRDLPPPLGLVESARRKALDQEGGERRAREWAEENRTSIEQHNRWVAEHGCFGEAWRSW